VTRRLLIIAALTGLLAASCSDLPEGEVAFGDGERFVPMVADAIDNVGLGNALAVDAEGNPYVSYFGFPSEEGTVTATRPVNSPFIPAVQLTTVADGIFVRGAAAQVQDVPAPAYVVPFGPQTVESLADLDPENANGTALAIADDGERHVAWSASDGVWHGSATADGSFSVEQVEATDDAIAQAGPLGPPSLALDDAGAPWIAYQVVTADGVEVRVATPGAETWEVDVAATTELCNGCSSPGAAPIVVRDGAPSALFVDPAAGEIAETTLVGARWQVATAIPGVEATGLAAVSDGGDGGYLSFYADGAVQLATGSGSSWTTAEVAQADVSGDDDPTTDVALDDEGIVYVAWQDADGVHMASGDGSALEPIETTDTEGGVMPSVAATSDGGTVYLSWYDADGQDLFLGMYGEVGDLVLAQPSPIPPPSPGAPVAGGGECGEDGEEILEISSSGTSFTTNCLVAPAEEEFTVTYDNPEPILHNFALYTEEGGDVIGATDQQTGPVVQELPVEALDAGEYYFQCDVHPTTMRGTLAAIEGGGGGGGGGAGNGGGGGDAGAEPAPEPGAEPDATPSATAAA